MLPKSYLAFPVACRALSNVAENLNFWVSLQRPLQPAGRICLGCTEMRCCEFWV